MVIEEDILKILAFVISIIVGLLVIKYILMKNVNLHKEQRYYALEVAFITIMVGFSLFQLIVLGDRLEHVIIYYLYYQSLLFLILFYIFSNECKNQASKSSLFSFQKKNYIPYLILLVLIIIFIFSQNLFTNDLITLDDYPYYYYQLSFFSTYGVKEFGSIFGFSNFFNAGMPESPLPYVGFNLLLFPFIALGFKITLLIQIMIIGVILFSYFIAKELLFLISKDQNTSRFNALIVYAFPLWIFVLFYGQIAFLLASYIIILLFLKLYQTIITETITQKKIFFYGICSGISILIHLSIFFILLAFGMLFIVYFRKSYSLRFWIQYVFISFGLGVLFVISFWIFPLLEILYSSGFTDILLKNFIEVFTNYIINYTSGILEVNFGRLPFLLYIMIICGIYLGIKKPKNKFEHFIDYTILFLLAAILISTFLPIFYFLGPLRFLTIIEIMFIVPLWRVIDQLLIINRITFKNPQKNTILSIILMFSVVFSIRLNFYNSDIDFTRKDEPFFSMVDWLNEEENFIPNSRILFQELSHEKTNHYYSGGHNVFYLPILTNFSILTGADIFNIYQKVTKVGFYDNQIFNTTFDNLDSNSLYYWLDFFCVSYIIGNTPESYQYFQMNPNFELKFNNSLVYIFYYKNFNSQAQFMHSNSTTASWRLEEHSQNRLRYYIQNVSENDHFIISQFVIKNWNIYYNDTKLEYLNTNEQSEFINFQLTASGDFEIKIEWSQSKLEKYSILISLIMFPIFVILNKIGVLKVKMKNEVQNIAK